VRNLVSFGNVVVLLRFHGFLLASALLATAPQPASPSGPQEWDRFVAGFLETYFAANPSFAARQGRHEFDGRLPDWSETGLRRWAQRLHQLRDSAGSFPLNSSDADRRFERDYLIARIDRDLFWHERADWPHRNPEWYTGQLDPNVYLAREYAPVPERMRAYIEYARRLPAALAEARRNLRPPLPKAYAAIGRGRFGGLATYLRDDAPKLFASVRDSKLQRQFRAASAAAVQALNETERWLAEQEQGGTDSFALGPGLFREMLQATEGVTLPLDSLKVIGEVDLKRNLAALTEACRRFAPGATPTDCVARANSRKPQGGAVELAQSQLDTLEKFVRSKGLVSVPGRERAQVREAPPYQRFNFAYIDIPGPYEKELPSTYYIAPPDPTWPAQEKADYVPARGNLLFVSVHEVWPGHFLQFLHSHRVRSTVARVFVGYGFAEGWAHYAEEMMWDAGLGGGDPEIHIGQLANALMRNVRYLSAIGLHTGGMTLAQSERMFREQAFANPAAARQQAARGAYDPAYLNYTLGKLMILQLRDEWTRSRGGRAAWRQFHDQLLSYGGPPIPLVRRALLGGGRRR
jgi:hypothetical protein